MIEELDLTEMPITAVLRNWMLAEGWSDEIEISDDGNAATVATVFVINDQDHRLYFEIYEKRDEFCVFLYSHFNVPIDRRLEIIQLINRVHGRIRLGRFWAAMDEKPAPLQFKSVIDLENSSLSTEQIDVILSGALSSFERFGPLFAQVAMTDATASEVWSDFLDAQKQQHEQQEALGPAQL